MRRIVTETEDPAEGGRRFQELVRSAVDRFNEGSLAQAGTMIDLANQIIADRKIDPVAAQTIRKKGDEALDPERLRKYAEAPDLHPQLRKVLNFFLSLTPEGLLGDLRREVKRERRRLLLLLLEVHGATAREAALAELRPMFGRGTADEDWYFRRNLLYLLRRIPRPPGTPIDEDVDLAVRHAELRFPAPLVKEAIANLGQLKHEKAEHTLIALLQDLETVLLGKPDETPTTRARGGFSSTASSPLSRDSARRARAAPSSTTASRKSRSSVTRWRVSPSSPGRTSPGTGRRSTACSPR